jgi:hypothetical protein
MTAHLSDELLSSHLDQALSPPEREEVNSHLESCPECSGRLRLMRATALAIAELPEEAPPRPLELSFLVPAADRPLDLDAARRRWRPPAWVAPVLAAAAVLLLAVSVAPGLLGRSGGGGAATTASAPERGAPVTGDNSHLNSGAAPPAGAAPAQGVAPPAADSSRKYFSAPSAGGLQLAVSASPPATAAGQPVDITLEARAGQAVTISRMTIVVRRAGSATTLATSSGRRLQRGERAELKISWPAGEVSGTRAPGDYVVEGHAVLSDGQDLVVSAPVRVS